MHIIITHYNAAISFQFGLTAWLMLFVASLFISPSSHTSSSSIMSSENIDEAASVSAYEQSVPVKSAIIAESNIDSATLLGRELSGVEHGLIVGSMLRLTNSMH